MVAKKEVCDLVVAKKTCPGHTWPGFALHITTVAQNTKPLNANLILGILSKLYTTQQHAEQDKIQGRYLSLAQDNLRGHGGERDDMRQRQV